MIESGYRLNAKSRVNASGPWQFMKGTAKDYGLRVGWFKDERNDIYKSTKAAALYFQDLYNIFGSWELALAAYNSGEYGMIKRIRGADTRNYYELSRKKLLPKETRNYVPKVAAIIYVTKNADRYAVNLPRVKKYKNPTKAVRLAKSAPAKRSVRKKSRLTYHKVRRGDNLSTIAARYKLSLSQIMAINGLKNSRIYPGQKLKITRSSAKRTRYAYHSVKRGDNLTVLARRFGTSVRTLRSVNKLRSSRIYPGQKIKIPAKGKRVHIVKRGDFLLKIARIYRTSISHIRRLNDLDSNAIYPGQKLLVQL